MFEKNLQDLVKGIRSHKNDPGPYISQCIAESRKELQSTDPFIKANAIRKLTYLQMLGYDMAWTAFNIVEVMSSERFAHKRIGYLAACQTFTQDTDVVLLCTNLFKKEFGSPNEYEVGLAINCLGNIATRDLSRDLLGDVVAMMNSMKPYVRKKAVLCMYKLYLRYPQGLRLTFDKLKDKMEDPSVSVVSAAVNVICELSHKNPKNYLGLAPNFFRLLTTSSNNWMLIKVVKLLGSLVPQEPRLARKLLEPLSSIIRNTPAKSLMYECINTLTLSLLYTKKPDGSDAKNAPSVVRLCNDTLRQFIEDPDQNLKYLGLVGLSNLMKSHSKAVLEHQDVILRCLADDDITIRMRALSLVPGMANKRNIKDLISRLVHFALSSEGIYRNELISRILSICSEDKYAIISDFEWYLSILLDLSHIHATQHGRSIADQLIDVAVRVEKVRAYAVEMLMNLIMEGSKVLDGSNSTMAEVLFAAGWMVGEYGECTRDLLAESDDEETEELTFYTLLEALLSPRTLLLPPHVQAVYMQSSLKLLTAFAHPDLSLEDFEELAALVVKRLKAFLQNPHVEVQERASSIRELIIALGYGWDGLSQKERRTMEREKKDNGAGEDDLLFLSPDVMEFKAVIDKFFKEELAPVNPKAQKRVPVPAGLDLEQPINKDSSRVLGRGDDGGKKTEVLSVSFTARTLREEEEEEEDEDSDNERTALRPDVDSYPRKQKESSDWESNPFYISSKRETNDVDRKGDLGLLETPLDDEYDEIGLLGSKEGSSKKKSKKKTSHSRKAEKYAVNKEELMPTGASLSDEGTSRRKSLKKERDFEEAANIAEVDLTTPLREDERIPDDHWFHREVQNSSKKKKEKSGRSRAPSSSSRTGKAEKSTKERRRKKEKGDVTPPTSSQSGIVADLLDLDFAGASTSAAVPSKNVLSTAVKKEKGDSTSRRKQKSTKSSRRWVHVLEERGVAVFAAMSLDPSSQGVGRQKVEIRLRFKLKKSGKVANLEARFFDSSTVRVEGDDGDKRLEEAGTRGERLETGGYLFRVASKLREKEEENVKMFVSLTPLLSGQELKGSISFEAKGNAFDYPVFLSISPSLFLQPTDLAHEDFLDLMASSSKWSARKLKFEKESGRDFAEDEEEKDRRTVESLTKEVRRVVPSSLVDEAHGCVALYARHLLGPHVAILIKEGGTGRRRDDGNGKRRAGRLTLELKTSDDSLTQALAEDLEEMVPR